MRTITLCLLFFSTFLGAEEVSTASFSFKMEAVIQTNHQDGIQCWKGEAENGNTYWVLAKQRQCSKGKVSLKFCDFMPLVSCVIPKSAIPIDSFKDNQGYWSLIFTEALTDFYLVSACSNEELVIVLITKTTEQYSPDHRNFIESLTFLK